MILKEKNQRVGSNHLHSAVDFTIWDVVEAKRTYTQFVTFFTCNTGFTHLFMSSPLLKTGQFSQRTFIVCSLFILLHPLRCLVQSRLISLANLLPCSLTHPTHQLANRE